MSDYTMPSAAVGPVDGSVHIRAADADDSELLARAILHASRSHLSRGLWDLVVAGGEQDRLDFLELLVLLDARSFCHYSNFLVAEGTQGCVAALSGYDPGEAGLVMPGHAIAAAWGEMGWSDAALGDAYLGLEAYQRALPQQKDGVWTVEWVWTVPAQRGRGLIGTLLERLLDEGRRRDYALAQVTTFIGNAAAERAYRRAGFRAAEEKRDAEFARLMAAPGLARYECELR